MSLFDRIFRPDEAKKSDEAMNNARTLFQTLTAYQPVFTHSKPVSAVKAETGTESVADVEPVLIQGINDTGCKQQLLHRSCIR